MDQHNHARRPGLSQYADRDWVDLRSTLLESIPTSHVPPKMISRGNVRLDTRVVLVKGGVAVVRPEQKHTQFHSVSHLLLSYHLREGCTARLYE